MYGDSADIFVTSPILTFDKSVENKISFTLTGLTDERTVIMSQGEKIIYCQFRFLKAIYV